MYTVTGLDLVWLALGLIPIALSAVRIARHGVSSAFSLVSIGTLLIWIGYHLTPWLSLRTGGWKSPLLQSSSVPIGISYSCAFMLALSMGYGPHTAVISNAAKVKLARTIFTWIRKLPPTLPIGLATTALLLAIISVGGLDELLRSTHPRGFGQWDERTTGLVLWQQLLTVSGILGLGGALLASVSYAYKGRTLDLAGLVLILVVASAKSWQNFSRGSGACFLIAAAGIVLPLKPNNKRIALAIALIVFGFYFNVIGYTQRACSPSGVLNFIERALSPDEQCIQNLLAPVDDKLIVGPELNIMNSIDPFSARVYFSREKNTDIVDGVVSLLLILNPVPSAFLPYKVGVGDELSALLGYTGTVWLTTPALAELYVLLGWWSSVFGILFGFILRKIDEQRIRGRPIYYICYLLAIMSLVVGLHSGLRAMTRPIIYSAVLVVGNSLWKARAQSASLRISSVGSQKRGGQVS